MDVNFEDLLPIYKQATGHNDGIVKTYLEYLIDSDSTKFFKILKHIINTEYIQIYVDDDPINFDTYMLSKYGIKLHYDSGYMKSSYDVVDNNKYLIFKLKF